MDRHLQFHSALFAGYFVPGAFSTDLEYVTWRSKMERPSPAVKPRLLKAFLGGPVGPDPSMEVFEFYRTVKSILFKKDILCICPLDISESLYWEFGDKRETWMELSDVLLSPELDMAIFLKETPWGKLEDSQGSQYETNLALKKGIPVWICECQTVRHPQDIVMKEFIAPVQSLEL